MNNTQQTTFPISSKEISVIFLVLMGLYLTNLANYLLFHNLVEIFSITVAICIFMMAWNSKYKIGNNYLLFTGLSFIFIAAIDLLHTLAYKGMGVFTGFDANLPTQLWIAARYLQGISLLVAPLFFYRKFKHNLNINIILLIYTIVTSLLIASIFYWKIFPDCFIEGKGLTTFKIVSEYVISFIMAASIYLLYKNKKEFDENVFSLIVGSIILLIFSELAFTAYASVFGFANMLGHLFKFIAFFLIYKAIIVMGFMKPYDLIFRDLKKSEYELTKHRDRLAELVEERTAQLALANERLNSELVIRRKTEEDLRKSESLLKETQAITKVGGWELDVPNNKLTWTDEVYHIYGVSREYNIEDIGKDMSFYAPEDIPKLNEAFKCALEHGEPYDLELGFIRANGERIRVRTIGKPEVVNGKVVRISGIFMDITDRKQAEEELNKHRFHLEELVNERTAELERMNRLFVGRQLKMVELKKRIAELERKDE